MSDKTIATRPISDSEKLMREKFYQRVVTQSDLLDKLSERLITLELAIPGLYATVLKLVKGDKVTLAINNALYITFGCWLLSLVLALAALIPRKWIVDPTILKQGRAKIPDAIGIEDFFSRSANFKRNLIIASSIFFFIGIFSAIFTL